MEAFLSGFKEIKNKLQEKRNNGLYLLPLHRCFAYYITRLLMNNYMDEGSKEDLNLAFNRIFKKFLPQKYQQSKEIVEMEFSSSLVATIEDVQIPLSDILKIVIDPNVQSVSFVHEIGCKKWVYLGTHLEYYPNIYYQVADKLSY